MGAEAAAKLFNAAPCDPNHISRLKIGLLMSNQAGKKIIASIGVTLYDRIC
jgi:hypothetical protein